MTEQRQVPSDQSAPSKIDALTVFSHAWAAQCLVQLVFYRHWFSEGLVAGYVVTALAIAVFMFPGRIWLFAAMLAASILYFISQWPFVVNHIFIDTFLSVAMFAALLVTAVIFRRSPAGFNRHLADEWFQKFAPVCGAIFAFMYFSIIVSKLNYGFFDFEVSCLTGMIEEAHAKRPILSPLLSLASVEFYFWFFMIAETLLPLMLVVRRTRLAAFYFGVPFHILLGLMGHWPFSAFMLSLYMLVSMPALLVTVRSIAGYLDAFRIKFVPWAPAPIAFAIGSGFFADKRPCVKAKLGLVGLDACRIGHNNRSRALGTLA